MPMPYTKEDWTKDLKTLPVTERLSRQDAQTTFKTLQGYTDTARDNILAAQQKMCDQANKSRRPADFGLGDKVFVLKRTWTTDQSSDVLTFPLTQQAYTIKALRGHSFELDVPSDWRGTKVFHADRLRKFADDPLPGQTAEQPQGEQVNPSLDEEWEVDQVLSSRLYYGRL